jgi:hypothetical protein
MWRAPKARYQRGQRKLMIASDEGNRTIRAIACPMGIDAEKFAEAADSEGGTR